MGRKKKYETELELREAQKRWRRSYYQRNKERCKKERMDDYWRKKGMDKEMQTLR